MRLHLIIAAILFLLNEPVQSQPSWRIDKLGVEDGLSEGNVYVIHQDKKGFMWIGTHGGLHRYDGYGFRVFQYTPFNFSTLGDNAVFFLKEDSTSGKFWIGGSSCLNEFDPETFTNQRFYYEKKQLEFADGVFVNSEEMLLACENEVLMFNTREKKFKEVPVYDENNKQVSLSRVENVASDKNGNFMIMSRTGVFFYDPVSKTCRRKTESSPDFSTLNAFEVFNVVQDRRGNYWIATNKKGLIHYESHSKIMTTISLPAEFKIESLRFDVITEDSKGDIWAGSSAGLFRVDPTTLISEFLPHTSESHGLLIDMEVNVITEDKNHFVWVGTVGAGIFKMIPVNSGFKNFVVSRNNSVTRTGTYIMAIHQAGNNIWFMNIWDQVGYVNVQDGEITLMQKPLLPEGYSWYSEGAITSVKKDELIILNGEARYDVIIKPGGTTSIQSRPSPGLSNIYSDKEDKVWYMVKAPVSKIFFRNDTIFGNQNFFDAKEDNKGNIWIGSSSGLIKFDPQQNVFTHFQHDDGNINSISSNSIYALEIDDDDQNIWMAAYNGGLCSFNIASGVFRHYGKEEGLSDNTVYAIEKDHHGNLWFSSNAGISAYMKGTATFRNYSVSDGLLNHEFNRRSSFKNEDGWLFFGGIYGIDYFHPDSIIKTNTVPVLAFTNFRIFNHDFVPTENNPLPVIELKPNERYVTIEFSSLDYSDQQKIQYAYRLNNNEWIKMGNQHILSFSDLATGDHHLYVKSTNAEGIWLDNAIECRIVVLPLWWQTWWFRIASILASLGLFVGAIRFYYHRKLEKQKIALEKQQAVEKERTRIATDMHDDLGANLSRIKFLSETIGIKRQRLEAIEDEVNSIRHYSHEMIDKMGEIVWALNEKNDSLSDLLAYTRSYSVEYLSQNGIQSNVETPENVPNVFVSGEFRRNIYLTVKEALHNIVKHSKASNVDIYVETGREIFIRIHDNGKGFKEVDIRPFSNGINNMKKRIASLGGNLEIHVNGGSTLILQAPLSDQKPSK